MKIAITASGTTLDDTVEPRFGRCPYFIFVDPESMDYEAMPNPNIALGGGAGPQSAQLMAEKGVAAVLTGNCGPNAFQTFGAAGIDVITGIGGSVREALEKFKSGQLKKSGSPTVKNHFGMGGGMGMGGGRGIGGGGRGMGGGGRGMGGGGGGMGGGGRGMGGGGMMRPAMTGAGPELRGSTAVDAAAETGTPKDAEIKQLKQTVEDLRRQLDEVRSGVMDSG
ncbi:NifB/NifX family molybdenum-iron cluster-binding protein [Desulfatitalea alkaliphila]|uniref:NifB/NifX family molybdenum-iron cluster-binding protein n=1 Tax=Desulfatitalea alkaliphila TaxID=2929485 RepID=A0AA41R3S0_9BACT|nr:NifB/NifX family molybdenum-iron cluster-binding protein [Desulfatitalea alkaliphila]MCJ8502519.1 NifB/NifX family molybdenum-iron cluster-binding protein [Desulfatitalea alkaliphila]